MMSRDEAFPLNTFIRLYVYLLGQVDGSLLKYTCSWHGLDAVSPAFVSDQHCQPSQTLRKLRQAIQNRRRGMLSGGIVLVHDNSRPHTALKLKNCWINLNGVIFDHPPYIPDLAPSDFHLFRKLKDFLGCKRFGSDEQLENAITTWLNELAADEYNIGILKIADRYDKCLNVGGDYAEK
ncbi:Histone-lysine N-methyltransferase SETMAR [Araneus ventricosus]|uniref:Histone-lysine N-methyltransferase SETMAR n=1 Tax=Araneus ventricosus TaxID=182803 RepID=A0A4Y2EC49_ARAVE|nr:Histone-lysine N-methyltransferase SETMAR [Araneus ventricosus]